MNIGIRTRVGTWLLLVSAIIAVASLVTISTIRDGLERSAEDTLRQLVELEENRLTAVLDDQRADAEIVAADQQLIAALATRPQGADAHSLLLETLLTQTMLAGSDTVAFRAVDRLGNDIGHTGEAAWQPDNMAIALDAMDRRTTLIGPGFQVSERDARLGIVTPVLSDQGEVLGALLLESELEPLVWLSGRYETFGDTAEALIYQRLDDGTCQLLTDLRFDRSASFTPLTGDFSKPCTDPDGQIFSGLDYRNAETLSAWSTIEGVSWGIAVKMDQQEVFALLSNVQRTLLTSLAAVAALLAIGWMMLVRPIGTRLSRAAAAAEQLASGNFNALINDHRSDEIGTMSAGMDRLARDLDEDIKRREEAESRLRYRADFDDLTGAMNRHRTTARLRELFDATEPFAIVFLDLDGFKEINDTYGHSIGDEVLRLVTDRVRVAAETQGGHELGRWGGDEFVVVAPNETEEGLAQLVEAIDVAFDAPFRTSAGEHRVGISIGTADSAGQTGSERQSLEDVLSAADASMYQMKRRRDRRVRVSPEAIKNVEEALADDRIDAYLQPLVAVDDTGAVHLAGAEALVRMRDKDGTIIFPDAFLPGLGAGEQAMAVDLRVLDQAAKSVADWIRQEIVPPDFYVAVNIGDAAMSDPRLVQKIALTIEGRGLAPSNLVVEIPETTETVDVGHITGLRDLGIQIAIDDVGCQFSNLERLVDIEADIAKLDRRWLPNDPSGSTKLELLGGLVDQCRMLDMKIIAEGIETQTQLELVRDLGVHCIQGYLFGRPIDVAQFERLWARPGGRSLRFVAGEQLEMT